MSKYTKIAAGTLAALTITVGTLATSTTEAHAWGKKGWGPGIGFGIAAGVIGAAALGSSHRGHCFQLHRARRRIIPASSSDDGYSARLFFAHCRCGRHG